MEFPAFRDSQPGGMLGLFSRDLFPGQVYFVNSSVAAATDSTSFGRDPKAPFATLDYAIGRCTADAEDVIFVMPNHTEVITSVTVDISGLTIRGVGQGTNKPTLTLSTTGAEINVTAANVTIQNLRLVGNVNNLVNFFDLDESNCILEDIDMVTSSAKEAYCFINFATTKDNLVIRRCTALQPSDPDGTNDAAGTGFLYLVDSENITFEDNVLLGSFETAVVHNLTTACKNFYSKNNVIRQDLVTGFIFELVAGATGHSRGDSGHNINADDATPAKMIGSYGTLFWFGTDSLFSNDSGGGGQGMIASESATS